ncbi:hypothetical protein CEXT_645881 [Caerostris extrusa]|uniref:Uncharacterized protein n=1 Tax=Caerostris extrusa TaxID=172846 RepID=A0AAV4MEZ5_CAEEX|nr:hypothetical protein CEXT_645881 [Caerostris extrusa]
MESSRVVTIAGSILSLRSVGWKSEPGPPPYPKVGGKRTLHSPNRLAGHWLCICCANSMSEKNKTRFPKFKTNYICSAVEELLKTVLFSKTVFHPYGTVRREISAAVLFERAVLDPQNLEYYLDAANIPAPAFLIARNFKN